MLAALVIVVITVVISRCKSFDKKQTTETTVAADTLAVQATKYTSVTAEAKTVDTQKPLTVTIQYLASDTAPVYISIYGTKNKFPDPKGQLKEYKFTPHGKELIAEITDMKFGTYALATYQDVNSSGKIDKNLIGIPTEGYAFSNNYKPTIKAPKFKD